MKNLMTLFAILITASVYAQTYDWKELNDKIEIAKNSANEKELITILQSVERGVASKNMDEKVGLYYEAYIVYNLSNISRSSSDKFEKYVEKGIKVLDDLNKRFPNFSDAEALGAAFYGNKIGLSPMINGMRYGSTANDLTEKSKEHGSENPRAFLLEGIEQIYKPAMFGGGMDKAEESVKKALSIFDVGKGKNEVMWGHAECYIWLGIIAKESGKKDEAKNYYNKSLELSPENGWVKFVLLPELDK